MNLVDEYISIHKGEDVEYRYIYRLTKKDFRGITAYGIEIERKDYVGLANVNLERDRIEVISAHIHKVKQLLVKLYTNQVSPYHLVDMVGSYVDEYAYEFDSEMEEKVVN
jgi:hypothetical protein